MTYPRVIKTHSLIDEALATATELRETPTSAHIHPDVRHWEIFFDSCRRADVKGNLVPDTFLDGLAIENGSVWRPTDQDFNRFLGLRVPHPLD